MSTEENKAVVRRFNEALWRGDEATARDTLAPDCTFHRIGGPDEILGIFRSFRNGIPDLSGTIEEMIAEDDKVVTRWTMRGTHKGEVPGPSGPLPPTVNSITYTGITINRVVNNKIVEDRFEADYYGLMEQLGGLRSAQSSESPS